MSDNVNWPMEMDRRNRELERMTGHRDELLRRIESLEAENASFAADLNEAIAQLEGNTGTMDMARARIKTLEAALREIEERLVALNAKWAVEGGPFDGGWISEVMERR